MIYGYYEIIQKKIQESRLKTHLLVRSWLQPKLGVIGTRYRLAARIRLANRWAAKHPKTTFAGVAGTLLLLLVSTVAIDSGNGNRVNRMSVRLPIWNRCFRDSVPSRQTRTFTAVY